MTEGHQFETEHFRFTDTELQLLRSRFPFKTISFSEIEKITITKGIRVRRPLLVLSFGLFVSAISLYVMLFTSGFLEFLIDPDFEKDSFQAFKAFGYFLLMGGFMLSIGVVAIYQATIPTWILRLELNDGYTQVFSLKKLFETNEVFKLAQFLRTSFSKDQLIIDNRIG